MVKLKYIVASTLPEVIISMALTTFLFGFVAWFIISIDQRKYLDTEMAIFSYHLDISNERIVNDNESVHYTYEDVEIIINQTQSKLNQNLLERLIVIKDKNNRIKYTYHHLVLCATERSEYIE